MKKNIREIPGAVFSKLKTITQKEVNAACVKTYRREELAEGILSHLSITAGPEGLICPGSVLPPETQGKYSWWNINGAVIVRKDLPKETIYHAVEAPNWGDPSNGYHTVYLPHEQYPRDFQPPRELQLLVKCLNQKERSETYVLGFLVDEVLDKTSAEFKELLLENLNLLQENVGSCGIEPANIPIEEYAKSLQVSWDILPPGSKEEVVARVFRGKTPTSEERENIEERYDFFVSLKAKQIVIGTSGFRRYFGALLEDNLVVFENVQYGNAVYLLYENWQELSQKSRSELLCGRFGQNFDRVIHKHGWKTEVRTIVRERREKKD